MSEKTEAFEGWAVLELMGHRRLGGRVSEATIAGQAFIRIDVPGPDGATVATQFYSGAAVYCLTPTSEAMARAAALRSQPEPVSRWELPQLPARVLSGAEALENHLPLAEADDDQER